MNSFFKYTLASILGFIIGMFLLFFILIIMGGALASSFGEAEKVTVPSNSILDIKLDFPIAERSIPMNFSNFDPTTGEITNSIGIRELTRSIEKAKGDSKIKGIILNLSMLQVGKASLEEIRNSILDFKTSGKFVWAYAENYMNDTYYLATAADKIYMYPEGTFFFAGMSAQRMFFKKTLDKLGVEVELVRPSDNAYKSFGEMFKRTEMSPESREMTKSYLGSIYNHFTAAITESRNISRDRQDEIANGLTLNLPKDAVELGFVDELVFYDQILERLRAELEIEEDKKLKSISLADYTKSLAKKKLTGDKVAVVYANGDIMSGKGNEEVIGSDRFAEALRKARKDKKVKAVVLRVNSPGGSALASDVMLREMRLLKEAGKPVVVSMGNVAASGGYYISAYADKIYAQPNTITGSIGVFGTIPNAGKMLEEKLGVTIDEVNTNEHSDFPSITRSLNTPERQWMQTYVEDTYVDFTTIVAEGRGIPLETVRGLARGRVYTGIQAKEIGLVDELGGLEAAIDYAAEQAGITDSYAIKELPGLKDPIQELLKSFGNARASSLEAVVGPELAPHVKHLKKVQSLLQDDPIQMRMEFDLNIK